MKRSNQTIRTTLGELAAAFYEAALAELKDEGLAAAVAQRMVQERMLKRRFA
ncbi:MAG: hypothetical protein IT382_14200 [Deltaproteobacteria bacterium]|nr:hypothetical protein [Deltaproteobacteria bacterium]